jgi:hypothetical protein
MPDSKVNSLGNLDWWDVQALLAYEMFSRPPNYDVIYK